MGQGYDPSYLQNYLKKAEEFQSFSNDRKSPNYNNTYSGYDDLKILPIKDDHIYALIHSGNIAEMVGGSPLSVQYFFDQATYDKFVDLSTGEFDASALSDALQIDPKNFPNYRDSIVCFDVHPEKVSGGVLLLPSGTCWANTQFGGGGGHQTFAPEEVSADLQTCGALQINNKKSLLHTGTNIAVSDVRREEIKRGVVERKDNCIANGTSHHDTNVSYSRGFAPTPELVSGQPFDYAASVIEPALAEDVAGSTAEEVPPLPHDNKGVPEIHQGSIDTAKENYKNDLDNTRIGSDAKDSPEKNSESGEVRNRQDNTSANEDETSKQNATGVSADDIKNNEPQPDAKHEKYSKEADTSSGNTGAKENNNQGDGKSDNLKQEKQSKPAEAHKETSKKPEEKSSIKENDPNGKASDSAEKPTEKGQEDGIEKQSESPYQKKGNDDLNPKNDGQDKLASGESSQDKPEQKSETKGQTEDKTGQAEKDSKVNSDETKGDTKHGEDGKLTSQGGKRENVEPAANSESETKGSDNRTEGMPVKAAGENNTRSEKTPEPLTASDNPENESKKIGDSKEPATKSSNPSESPSKTDSGMPVTRSGDSKREGENTPESERGAKQDKGGGMPTKAANSGEADGNSSGTVDSGRGGQNNSPSSSPNESKDNGMEQ